jgi:hypothetical protein
MRIVFGVLSLLLVLAIVGSLAKTQLHALGIGGTTTRMSTAASAAGVEPLRGSRDDAKLPLAGGVPGATAADGDNLTVREQSRNIQQQFRDDTARALQQGVDRNARAPQ